MPHCNRVWAPQLGLAQPTRSAKTLPRRQCTIHPFRSWHEKLPLAAENQKARDSSRASLLISSLNIIWPPWLPQSIRAVRARLPADALPLLRHVPPCRNDSLRARGPTPSWLLPRGDEPFPDPPSHALFRRGRLRRQKRGTRKEL